jgi:hypothetical protein
MRAALSAASGETRSLSPKKHFWAVCTDYSCQAVGIFPDHFQHGVFCDINCRDGAPGSLESVSYESLEDYQQASLQAVQDSDRLAEAYVVARQARFEYGQTPKKPSHEKQYREAQRKNNDE